MAKYRHTRTGAVREMSARVGFPWEEITESGSGSSSSTKPELMAQAKSLGLSEDGTKAELTARIAAHEAASSSSS